jgi:hypothetical protein
MSTRHTEYVNIGGTEVPLSIPNAVVFKAADFYISYNDVDTDVYGSDTTALVVGQMSKFYILKGDHREGYKGLATLEDCLTYYRANLSLSHSFSDPL